MTTTDHDRSLLHPIEELRDVAELVRVLNRIAVGLEARQARETEMEVLQRTGTVNECLFSGALRLDQTVVPGFYTARKSLPAPFASVTISDSNNLGPLLIVADEGAEAMNEGIGVGRWKVPVGQVQTFPMTSNTLTITNLNAAPASGIVYLALWSKPQGRGN